MPHMMPMMWTMIFILSLLSIFILTTMIYFFYVPPSLPLKKINRPTHKWNWMW